MLELRLLQAHTDRCPECARVAADIGAISETIRSAPLELPPARSALPASPRRRIRDHVPRTSSLGRIAAVAVVGLFAFSLGSRSSEDVRRPVVSPRPIVIDETTLTSVAQEPAELRAYRRTALLSETFSGKHARFRTGPQAL
jgi:anti-sigma factor RsiW